jgi:hypothetical protein
MVIILLQVVLKLFGIRFAYQKKKGGVGVKNLEVWNQLVMVKHLWIICIKAVLLIWSS